MNLNDVTREWVRENRKVIESVMKLIAAAGYAPALIEDLAKHADEPLRSVAQALSDPAMKLTLLVLCWEDNEDLRARAQAQVEALPQGSVTIVRLPEGLSLDRYQRVANELWGVQQLKGLFFIVSTPNVAFEPVKIDAAVQLRLAAQGRLFNELKTLVDEWRREITRLDAELARDDTTETMAQRGPCAVAKSVRMEMTDALAAVLALNLSSAERADATT